MCKMYMYYHFWPCRKGEGYIVYDVFSSILLLVRLSVNFVSSQQLLNSRIYFGTINLMLYMYNP